MKVVSRNKGLLVDGSYRSQESALPVMTRGTTNMVDYHQDKQQRREMHCITVYHFYCYLTPGLDLIKNNKILSRTKRCNKLLSAK